MALPLERAVSALEEILPGAGGGLQLHVPPYEDPATAGRTYTPSLEVFVEDLMGSSSARCPMSTRNKRMVLTRPRGHDSLRSFHVGQLVCDYAADFIERRVGGRVNPSQTLIADLAQGLEVPLSGFRARVIDPICTVLEAVIQGEPGGIVGMGAGAVIAAVLARPIPTLERFSMDKILSRGLHQNVDYEAAWQSIEFSASVGADLSGIEGAEEALASMARELDLRPAAVDWYPCESHGLAPARWSEKAFGGRTMHRASFVVSQSASENLVKTCLNVITMKAKTRRLTRSRPPSASAELERSMDAMYQGGEYRYETLTVLTPAQHVPSVLVMCRCCGSPDRNVFENNTRPWASPRSCSCYALAGEFFSRFRRSTSINHLGPTICSSPGEWPYKPHNPCLSEDVEEGFRDLFTSYPMEPVDTEKEVYHHYDSLRPTNRRDTVMSKPIPARGDFTSLQEALIVRREEHRQSAAAEARNWRGVHCSRKMWITEVEVGHFAETSLRPSRLDSQCDAPELLAHAVVGACEEAPREYAVEHSDSDDASQPPTKDVHWVGARRPPKPSRRQGRWYHPRTRCGFPWHI